MVHATDFIRSITLTGRQHLHLDYSKVYHKLFPMFHYRVVLFFLNN